MAEVKQLIALSHTRSTGKLCVKWLASARAGQEEELEEEQAAAAAAAAGETGRGTQVLVGNLPRLVQPVHILGALQGPEISSEKSSVLSLYIGNILGH
jgi:hypothetical protein